MMDAKRLAVIIGIAVLLPLFFGLFMEALYPTPEYNDFCTEDRYPKAFPQVTQMNCSYDVAYSSPEAQACNNKGGMPRMTYNSSGCEVFDRCDYCNQEYETAREKYDNGSLAYFLIIVILGLISVIIGIFLTTEYIGAGLMFGGVITMFYGTIRYFSDIDKTVRALVIFVELLIIIWIAYKKIGGTKQNPDRKAVKRRR